MNLKFSFDYFPKNIASIAFLALIIGFISSQDDGIFFNNQCHCQKEKREHAIFSNSSTSDVFVSSVQILTEKQDKSDKLSKSANSTQNFITNTLDFLEKAQMTIRKKEKVSVFRSGLISFISSATEIFNSESVLGHSFGYKRSNKDASRHLHSDIVQVLKKIQKKASLCRNTSNYIESANSFLDLAFLAFKYVGLCVNLIDLCFTNPLNLKKRPNSTLTTVEPINHRLFCDLAAQTKKEMKVEHIKSFIIREIKYADQSFETDCIEPEQWLGNYYCAYFCLQILCSILQF